MTLRSYACAISWWHDKADYTIVNELSRGRAKAKFFREVSEPWPDLKYTDIRCRVFGPPHTSSHFIRNAAYRQIPSVRCGDKVQVGAHGEGLIVGHNSSANFDVLFTTGKWKGLTLNVHPSDLKGVS